MLPFKYIYIRKTELTENDNFHVFAADGKRKWQTLFCFVQTENGSLFSLVGKRSTVVDIILLCQQTCTSYTGGQRSAP
jgi:hypothetical protein